MSNTYFLTMLQNLRQQEELVLYGNLLYVAEEEATAIIEFSRIEYLEESLDFPYDAPLFDANAAFWAAKTVYIAAQLILYRANQNHDLTLLLPDYEGIMSNAAILSSDLYLRFLPDMLIQLKLIDSQDALITILEKHLTKWHYSGIKYDLEMAELDFSIIEKDFCIKQLYVNRVFVNKKTTLMKHPVLKDLIAANKGIYF